MPSRIPIALPFVLAAACQTEANVEEVDRGAKPIEARTADLEGLAAWNEPTHEVTLVSIDGARRGVVTATLGDLQIVVITSEDGRPLAAAARDVDGASADTLGPTAAALLDAILSDDVDLARVRADLLDSPTSVIERGW